MRLINLCWLFFASSASSQDTVERFHVASLSERDRLSIHNQQSINKYLFLRTKHMPKKTKKQTNKKTQQTNQNPKNKTTPPHKNT